METIGYAYHADIYCDDCGADLPRTDPEGNEKSPIFDGTEADYVPHCATCGFRIEGYWLTAEGVAYTLDAVARAVEKRDVNDTIEEWLKVLSDYESGMTIGDRALLAALYAGDDEAAFTVARYYRDVTGDDLHGVPATLQDYWPL